MTTTGDIGLSTLHPDEVAVAAAVAARGMRDNPSSVALGGTDPARRVRALEPLYHLVLSSLKRPALVARRQGVIVGIAALAPPDTCFFRQTSARERTIHVGSRRVGVMIPYVPRHLLWPLLRLGPRGLGRLSTWGETSLKHDPQVRHQHVELVVVEAALQGQGIGKLMMEELCKQMDQVPELSYLETDKPENVQFYERFGFKVSGESSVLGTQNWYMERPFA